MNIKCELGRAYEVAAEIADAELASEIFSTSGDWDLMAKCYVDDDVDIGHFVNNKIHAITGIRDTYTVLTFRAF